MTLPCRPVLEMIIIPPAPTCLNNPLHFGVEASGEPVQFH